MYRPKSSTLSILERAQGQLSGKRFGKKTSTWSHQKDEPNEEEDELKAYLSQLQKRTAKPVLSDDISDDSDEVYRPKTSTPLRSGSQFLKSNRANRPSPAADDLSKDLSKQATIKQRQPSQNGGKASSNIIESSSDISSVSEEQFGITAKAPTGRQRVENSSDASGKNKQQDVSKRSFHGRATPAVGKSAAYDRIMSNLGSDEDDVMDMINSIESNSSSQHVDVPVMTDAPTKNENTPFKEPVKAAASPLEQSISQPTNSPVPDEVEEIASISEVIPTDTSGGSQGDIKLNIFQVQDLEPAVESKVEEDKGVRRDKVKTDKNIRKGSHGKQPSGKQAWPEEDVKKGTKRGDPDSQSEAPEEVDSDVKSEINTLSELKDEPSVESDRTQSDEDTDVIASSYSSIASHRSSSSSASRSSKTSRDSRRSSGSGVSTRRTTSRSPKLEKHSTAKQSSYFEDFHSDTYRSRSVSSSETLTPTSGAAPKHSPTPPVTPSPVPKKTRTHRVKDKGIQTSDVPYSQNHWVFDHGPSGRSVDVSELTRDFKTTSVAPETLHALSSINYTSLLLHQTLKMQFRQTQQSIDRMLQIHQSLLESVQADYTYATLEDTKAYIKRQRENGKR